MEDIGVEGRPTRSIYFLKLIPTMGPYILLPKTYVRRTREQTPGVPEGLTHPQGAPCPFATENRHRGLMPPCCSIGGVFLFNALEILQNFDDRELCDQMSEDMTPQKAIKFGRHLRDIAQRQAGQYSTERDLPWLWLLESTLAKEGFPELEDLLGVVRAAGDWYEKIGQLGFGVKAEWC